MTHHHCPKCNQGIDRSLGPQVAPCPTTPGSLWVQVCDERGVGVSGVPVEVEGNRVLTDAVGLAAFESLAEGDYAARLGALPTRADERFDPPASAELHGIAVREATVTSAEFVLRRWPTLKVRLSTAVAATVTLDEGDGDERSVDTKDGTASFGPVKPGAHRIEVKTRDSTEARPALEPSKRVDLGYAEDHVVEVDMKTVVDPTIETEVDALAVDGAPLRVTLGASAPFGGRGRLQITAGAHSVRVFVDGQRRMLTGGVLDVSTIPAEGYVLELRAVEPSALEGVKLRWELLGGDVEVGPPVTRALTAVWATLVIHDPEGVALSRVAARGDGRVLAAQTPDGARARAKVKIHCEPPQFEGQLRLRDRGGERLALYSDAQGGAALDSPYQRDWPDEDIELYVEGRQPSPRHGDDGLELDIVGLGEAVDHVGVTVVRATLDVFGPKEGEAEPEAMRDGDKRDPGRALLVQGWDFKTPRAKVRVRKEPADAPCTLTLNASDDALRLLAEGDEQHHDDEVAHPRPLSLDPEAFAAQDAVVLWAEATAVPEGGTLTLDLRIDGIEEDCDSIAFAPTQGQLDVDVTWRDDLDLAADVRVRLLRGRGDDDTHLFERLISPGDPTVSFSVPPASYRVTFVSSADDEKFRIVRGPARDGSEPEHEARVEVEGATPASACYTLMPAYQRVQFVAYQLQTGQYKGRDRPSMMKGKLNAAKGDLKRRCGFMRAAIDRAATQDTIDPSPTTLKIFMAPEFYFRGATGAYPLGTLSEILGQMATLTRDPKYRDWMFVYGSALGALRTPRGPFDPEAPEREGRVEHRAELQSVSTIVRFAVDPTLLVTTAMCLVDSDMRLYQIDNIATLGLNGAGQRRYQATLNRPLGFGKEAILVLNPDKSEDEWEARNVELSHCIARVTLRSPVAPQPGWGFAQGKRRGVIEAVANTPIAGEYRVQIGSQWEKLAMNQRVTLVDPEQIEIFNVALVQQGGPHAAMRSNGRAALRELLVYKEQMSSVDFLGPDYGDNEFYETTHHLGKIQKDDLSKLRPTAGARGVLAQHPNAPGGQECNDQGVAQGRRVTEVTENGLGGGSVFTMNDITFGLEVCLDHGMARLVDYYNNHAQAGEPRVQVQLIPSCGMQIKTANCLPGTVVFNVDAYQHSAKANGGGTPLTPTSTTKAPFPWTLRPEYKLSNYFPNKGVIAVYPSQLAPPASTVP